jgi:hypothetical protein
MVRLNSETSTYANRYLGRAVDEFTLFSVPTSTIKVEPMYIHAVFSWALEIGRFHLGDLFVFESVGRERMHTAPRSHRFLDTHLSKEGTIFESPALLLVGHLLLDRLHERAN